jgi:hypothetical protein
LCSIAVSDAMGGAPAEVKNQDVIEVPPIGNHGHDSVADWLLSLGFQHYLGLFIANGFDDVDFLVSFLLFKIFWEISNQLNLN